MSEHQCPFCRQKFAEADLSEKRATQTAPAERLTREQVGNVMRSFEYLDTGLDNANVRVPIRVLRPLCDMALRSLAPQASPGMQWKATVKFDDETRVDTGTFSESQEFDCNYAGNWTICDKPNCVANEFCKRRSSEPLAHPAPPQGSGETPSVSMRRMEDAGHIAMNIVRALPYDRSGASAQSAAGAESCCGEYTTCHKPCTVRGAYLERAGMYGDIDFVRPAPPAVPKAAHHKAHGLTVEMIAQHYPVSQHQLDECEMCHAIHEIAQEAIAAAPRAKEGA